MRYQYAKRLHNGDEVRIKSTGEICTVISTQEFTDAAGKPAVQIYTVTRENGYCGLHHQEIQ
jgi:hypothetical protein